MKKPQQRPEGALLERVIDATPGMSRRSVAIEVGLSEARVRQIVNGYASAGRGQRVDVVAPPETLARLAAAVGLTEEQLREVGREDAAAMLADVPRVGVGAGRTWSFADATGDLAKMKELGLAALRAWADLDQALLDAESLADVRSGPELSRARFHVIALALGAIGPPPSETPTGQPMSTPQPQESDEHERSAAATKEAGGTLAHLHPSDVTAEVVAPEGPSSEVGQKQSDARPN